MWRGKEFKRGGVEGIEGKRRRSGRNKLVSLEQVLYVHTWTEQIENQCRMDCCFE